MSSPPVYNNFDFPVWRSDIVFIVHNFSRDCNSKIHRRDVESNNFVIVGERVGMCGGLVHEVGHGELVLLHPASALSESFDESEGSISNRRQDVMRRARYVSAYCCTDSQLVVKKVVSLEVDISFLSLFLMLTDDKMVAACIKKSYACMTSCTDIFFLC
jgi:hypothetical protein